MLHHPEDNSEPEVFQVDPPQQEDMNLGTPSLPPPKFIAKCPASTGMCPPLYDLVECNSEILVITLRGEQYSLYRLADLMLGRTVPLTCINGSTIFFSRQRSLHVSSEAFPTIVADTIVLFEPIKTYLAQYHLNSGTLSAASDGRTPGIAFPSPCTITPHIFTCCFREYWLVTWFCFYVIVLPNSDCSFHRSHVLLCCSSLLYRNKGQIIFHGNWKDWRVKRKWRHGVSLTSVAIFLL